MTKPLWQIGRFYKGDAAAFCGLWSDTLELWVSDYVDATDYDQFAEAHDVVIALNNAFHDRGAPYRAIVLSKS